MTTVTIHHNEHDDHFDGYVPGHPVRNVFTYEDPFTNAPTPTELADAAYHLFNAPPEMLDSWAREVAAQYRAKRLRSLSKGDLVQVGETWLACASVGWTPVDAPTEVTGDTS